MKSPDRQPALVEDAAPRNPGTDALRLSLAEDTIPPEPGWLGAIVGWAVDVAFTYRRVAIVAVHVGLIVLSNFLAFALRFDGAIPPQAAEAWKHTTLLLIGVRALTFVPLRLYEGLWRYTGIWDLKRIVVGVLLSSVIMYGLVGWVLRTPGYPRSIYLIDSVLLIMLMGGLRLGRRIYREAKRTVSPRRVLVIGAGDAGEMIVRDMFKNQSYGMTPIGFIDDDPGKSGKRIHGVPVIGPRHQIAEVLAKLLPDEILIAIPSETPAAIRKIAQSLQPFKIPITTLPSIRDLVQGTVTVSNIRPLAIEDLLARAPVGLDYAPVRTLIEGRRVLVTGAGGSIGSELCRQIAKLNPETLALVDRYENSLHAITVEMDDHARDVPVRAYLADVTDRVRIRQVLDEFRPAIVFHAAAHKHVPVVEMNPSEGVKNNVLGTRILAEESKRAGVDRFVFISTDKAVNPSSVMGATKRVAEFCIQGMANGGPTSFCVVRFGNVLGSNGSVVPRFLDQIRAGGPVTVTHPDMKRFFMLIPEAVQLVLHAAAQAEAGVVYVLEMGDQINVTEMARNLIRLSGYVPGDEIQIEFIGLRPGEKLYEELIGIDEVAEPSGMEGIQRVRLNHWDRMPDVTALTDRAISAAQAGRDEEVVALLGQIVPTYTRSDAARPEIRRAVLTP
jgi:FlaA1/EpsC-like NDP-sugar epimerase